MAFLLKSKFKYALQSSPNLKDALLKNLQYEKSIL